MKRFAWSLQRLLDVTLRREQALKGQLSQLSAQIGQLRRQVATRRMALKRQLDELAKLSLGERMQQMPTFIGLSKFQEQEIAQLQEQSRALQERRQQMMKQYLEVRASRQTLEKLRERAWRQYMAEVAKAEQKLTDETAGLAYARKMQHRVPAGK
jgi:flagellar protein FliJ